MECICPQQCPHYSTYFHAVLLLVTNFDLLFMDNRTCSRHTYICIYSFNKISALSLTKFHLVLRGFQNVHRGDIDILLKLKSGVVWRGQAKYSCALTSYWPQPPCAPHPAAAACPLRRRAAARIAPQSRGWSSSWRSACADICRGLSHWCLSALCWGTDPPSVACHRYYR